MVSVILDHLCTMADNAKDKGFMDRKKVIDECIDEIHHIYYTYQKCSFEVDKKVFEPKDDIEKYALQVHGLKIKKDRKGHTRYEVDKMGFDTPAEVIEHVIQEHAKKFTSTKTAAISEGQRQFEQIINDLEVPTQYRFALNDSLRLAIRRAYLDSVNKAQVKVTKFGGLKNE